MLLDGEALYEITETRISYHRGDTAAEARIEAVLPAGSGRWAVVTDATPFHPVDAAWPEFDREMLVEDQVTLAIQVNGKLRDTLNAPRGLDRAAAEELALGSEKVQRLLEGNAPRKVIVVPDRLVNIVA